MEHANHSIKCSVKQCAYHCHEQDYCSLDSISIGAHEANVCDVECTDCRSFMKRLHAFCPPWT